MRTLFACCFAAALFVPALPVRAEVDWSVVRSLQFEGKPLDTVISADNTRFFVLVEEGKVLVYSPGGELQETLLLENSADGIELSK